VLEINKPLKSRFSGVYDLTKISDVSPRFLFSGRKTVLFD